MFLKKKDTHSRKIDIAFFAVALTFFLYSVQVLLKSPPPQERTEESKKNNVVPKALQRSLASNPTAYNQKQDTLKSLDIGCWKHSLPPLETSAALVQISGKNCSGTGAIKELQNETSKEEIQIFYNPNTKMNISQYFSLQEGRNRIRWSTKKGPQYIEIIRSPTAK